MRQSATISARQLTPVTHNHRLRWLAAVAPRDRFLCSDTSAVVSVPDSIVGPLFDELIETGFALPLAQYYTSEVKSLRPTANIGHPITRLPWNKKKGLCYFTPIFHKKIKDKARLLFFGLLVRDSRGEEQNLTCLQRPRWTLPLFFPLPLPAKLCSAPQSPRSHQLTPRAAVRGPGGQMEPKKQLCSSSPNYKKAI